MTTEQLQAQIRTLAAFVVDLQEGRIVQYGERWATCPLCAEVVCDADCANPYSRQQEPWE